MTTKRPTSELSIGDLETVYDLLANGIDQAGQERDRIFLVKLALLCAKRTGDAKGFQQDIEQALRDLP
jgi:hypothetical protein